MTLSRRKFYRVVIPLAFGLLAIVAAQAQPSKQKTAEEWQAMARADLDAARAVILAAHPGSIDELNPGFRAWTEAGYHEALALIPQVMSYDTALSAVRFYATGFLDGHLIYSDNVRGDFPIFVNGWRLQKANGKYLVSALAENWPAALPPKGAALIQCDGRSPDAILKQDVAPFVDRRDLPAVLDRMASQLNLLHLSDLRLKRCQFSTDRGAVLDLDIKYAPVTVNQYFETIARSRSNGSRTNEFSLRDGVLWIHARNFNLQPATSDASDLEAMLRQLRALNGVKQIVFDTRGNGGGDSGVGNRIFEAATGGLEYDRGDSGREPRTYAQWRVSDVSIATAARFVGIKSDLYGANSEPAAQAARHLTELRNAKAAGRPWVEQAGGLRFTRADVERRHGKLRRFDGQLALLTDERCASACLDFADLVRQVPGSIHMGRTTSADSVYIDMGSAKLPSGNLLFIPLKVWRNRIRANNETLVPDLPLDVDMNDDRQVAAAALAALAARRQSVEGTAP